MGKHCRALSTCEQIPLNLPAGLTRPWPGLRAMPDFGGGDSSTVFLERAEIYDHVERVMASPAFATIAGDRHSFWAGLAAKLAASETTSPRSV